jgi:hypothetical protein
MAVQRRVQTLADHLLELQGSGSLSPELADACDLPAWQAALVLALSSLCEDPQGAGLERGAERLTALTGNLEERLDAVMGNETSAARDAELYRVLGAYRSVAEAVLGYLGSAAAIDRAAWLRRAFP